MQVESDGLICVCSNPKMPLFVILSSRTISSIHFESDRALWTKAVTVFHFIVENKSFCFRRSYSNNASLFIFIANFLNPPI